MNKKHVLIADGDKAFGETTQGLLESRQFKVNLAHTGADVLEKASQYPDIILLDRVLPDADGLNICKQIRHNKRLQHISIIILAQESTSADRVQGLQLGADDYMAKSVDGEELVARIEAILRRNEVFRQNQEKKGALTTELKKILNEKLITPYFQPVYSMKSRLAFGLEALSRPPTSGLIDNAEFLFKTALILDMYSEVELLCWRLAVDRWKKVAGRGKLFLNSTPYFIESGRLNKDFLKELKIDLRNLVLEITERTAIRKKEKFLQELNMLKGLGVNIAVDDVGSGFASLDTVVEIRPDIVKIDRHLVRNFHNDELRYNIMQAVVAFCKKSKIMTVAEGIEYDEELSAVSDLGIDAVQGFLIGKPASEISPDIFTKKFGG